MEMSEVVLVAGGEGGEGGESVWYVWWSVHLCPWLGCHQQQHVLPGLVCRAGL